MLNPQKYLVLQLNLKIFIKLERFTVGSEAATGGVL